MAYGECKIYNDGSHFIAIPYRPGKSKRRPKRPEELITVEVEDEEETGFEECSETAGNEALTGEEVVSEKECEIEVLDEIGTVCEPKTERKMTRKELFEELYEKSKNMQKQKQMSFIERKMRPYFQKEENLKLYVQEQFFRKQRNISCRRVRLSRKVNLAEFNYFVTFTYADVLHTEDSFKQKMKAFLRNMTFRKNWRYAGVWERSPRKQRLHFHGLFDIPVGTMPGEIEEVRDYSPIKKKVQIIHQNTYLKEKFGRNDFDPIDSKAALGEAIGYLTKYIGKTGEKIVYSRNLPQYFISDIMDEDVVCTIGQEDRKLLLFDDFGCWDEGCYMGKVSPDVIKQMRKAN